MKNDSDYGLSLDDNDDVSVITFHCGRGHTIRVHRMLAGQKGKCSKCGEPVRIPDIPRPAPWMRFAAWFIKALGILKGVESSGIALPHKNCRIKKSTGDHTEAFTEHKDQLTLVQTTLSDEAAKFVAQYDGHLAIFGLTSISEEVAWALAEHKGKLSLGGLTSISEEVARALAEHKGDFLMIHGEVASISEEVAKALAMYKGELHVHSLTTLSDQVAQALSQHEGVLGLDRLTAISDEAAKALSQYKSGLNLNGLATLSDKAAEALSQHQSWLSLEGLTTLSDEAAKALGQGFGEFISQRPDDYF